MISSVESCVCAFLICMVLLSLLCKGLRVFGMRKMLMESADEVRCRWVVGLVG